MLADVVVIWQGMALLVVVMLLLQLVVLVVLVMWDVVTWLVRNQKQMHVGVCTCAYSNPSLSYRILSYLVT